MGVRVFGSVTLALSSFLLAAASGYAQAPPPAPPPLPSPPPQVGFLPPYEIMRTVRASGFDPLAPPLREGTNYVLRATDFRGILMRVVVDANTGAIRAVNRIVPGPGSYGQIGMVPPPPYGRPPYDGPAYGGPPDDMMPPPYDVPPDFDGSEPPPLNAPGPLPAAPSQPPAIRPVSRPSVTVLPPLPRPRPAEIAARRPIDDVKPETTPDGTAASKTDAKSEIKPDAKPDVKATNAAPAAVTATPPIPAPAPAKPGKAASSPAIND